jgi:predicted transcriptional regulator
VVTGVTRIVHNQQNCSIVYRVTTVYLRDVAHVQQDDDDVISNMCCNKIAYIIVVETLKKCWPWRKC